MAQVRQDAGRWDYIFSLIKNFRTRGPRFVLPDRAQVTMTAPFMRAYTEQLVRACHKRGAMAVGGMAAAVPNRKDEAANANAFEKVRADKTREANDGFDGSWVAHPDLVPVCREVFDSVLGDKPNQLDRLREDVTRDDRALINVAATQGTITEQGTRNNIESRHPLHRVLAPRQRCGGHPQPDGGRRHRGDLPLATLAVDLLPGHHRPRRDHQPGMGGRKMLDEEFAQHERFDGDRFEDARDIFEEVTLSQDFPSFLTLPAYARYLTETRERATVEELSMA